MKQLEFRMSMVMVLIPLAFFLIAEGMHQDGIILPAFFVLAGILAFTTGIRLWKRVMSLAANEDKQREERETVKGQRVLSELVTMNKNVSELIQLVRPRKAKPKIRRHVETSPTISVARING